MPDKVRQWSRHQFDIGEEHQPLMNLRPASVYQRQDDQHGEDQRVENWENCFVHYVTANREAKIAAQIEAAPNHRDRRCVGQRNHQREDEDRGHTESSVPYNVPGRN